MFCTLVFPRAEYIEWFDGWVCIILQQIFAYNAHALHYTVVKWSGLMDICILVTVEITEYCERKVLDARFHYPLLLKTLSSSRVPISFLSQPADFFP
jgi:hypothetical protein